MAVVDAPPPVRGGEEMPRSSVPPLGGEYKGGDQVPVPVGVVETVRARICVVDTVGANVTYKKVFAELSAQSMACHTFGCKTLAGAYVPVLPEIV